MLTSPLETCRLKLFNFLAGRSVAWIYPYGLIFSYMKTDRRVVLVSGGEGRRFGL